VVAPWVHAASNQAFAQTSRDACDAEVAADTWREVWSHHADDVAEDARSHQKPWPSPCVDNPVVDHACTWDDGTEEADDGDVHEAAHRDAVVVDGTHDAWHALNVEGACDPSAAMPWVVDVGP
jgi:hypothetical protein